MNRNTTIATMQVIVVAIVLLVSSGCSSKGHASSVTLKQGEMPTAIPTTTQSSPTQAPSGFHVAGNQILDSTGKVFVARGLEVYDVSRTSWKLDLARDNQVGNLGSGEFQAASNFWHANLIRVQLAEDNLASGSTPGYLTEIDHLVNLATSNGMAIIVSDQTEETSNNPAPTQESVSFWSQVAAHYGHNPSVIFDLFNEWRIPWSDVGGEAQAWQLWQNGGTDPTTKKSYVGMQQLVNAVRSTGATNLILAQGIGAGEVLDQVTSHLLTGGNIAYAVHPYFNASEVNNPTSIWDNRFGIASQSVPVMADEWGEYQSAKGECFPGAPAMVPQLFSYLKSHHIGIVGWALFPGILIRGWSWTTPTAFDQSSYTCGPSIAFPNMSPTAEGAGYSLLSYFASQIAQ